MSDSNQNTNIPSGEETPFPPDRNSDAEMSDLEIHSDRYNTSMELDSDDDSSTPFLDSLDSILDLILNPMEPPLFDHQPDDEHDDGPDSFLSCVQKFAATKVWPDVDSFKISVEPMIVLHSSWDIFFLSRVQSDENYVLRILKEDGVAATWPDSHRAFVAKNTFARDIAGLPVPKIAKYDYKEDSILQKPYILQEKVSGVPLANICMCCIPQADKCQLAAELGLHCRKFLKASSSTPGEVCLPDDLKPGDFHVKEIKAHRPLTREEASAGHTNLSEARPFADVENMPPIYPYSKIIHCMLADQSIMEGQAYQRQWSRQGTVVYNPATRNHPATRSNFGREPRSQDDEDDEDDEDLEAYRQHMRDPSIDFERRFFDEGERGMFDDMDVTNPHRAIFARNQDMWNSLIQLAIRLKDEAYLEVSDQDRYALIDINLHPSRIMVDMDRAPGAPMITAFLPQSSFGFAPKFSACKPPSGLWCDNAPFATNTEQDKVAAQMPKDDLKAHVRKVFDMAAGPDFVKMAYDTKYRLERGLYDFAWLGLDEIHEYGRVLDALKLLLEAAEVFEDFELPASIAMFGL